MSTHEQSDWDSREPSVLADQRRAYDDMRDRCPVAHSEALGWSLFRHADVQAVLSGPETYSNTSKHHAIPNAMDGPEHTRYRGLLEPYFAEERMEAVEPQCREIAAEAALTLRDENAPDAIASFAEIVALKTMCMFLGWPPETWERVRTWLHGNQKASFDRDREAGAAMADEYVAMVKDANDANRRANVDPDNVTSRLMATEVDGAHWTDEDIADTLRNWIAGHGTVVAAIGIVAFHLAEDQRLQQELRDQPGLVAAAIEEILRVDGPLVANRRTPTRDVTIGDRRIPAGERISLMWIAANRDEHAFTDATSIRLDRDQEANLAFGAGIHICLGAPLARLEMRIAIEELLAHTTRISLEDTDTPVRDTYPSNGLTKLPLRIS
ncbi:MAG: cytochrome P450 [Chloroflexia bacterium]|nr:cytochrome P450 [Chloroflexia bacterium]